VLVVGAHTCINIIKDAKSERPVSPLLQVRCQEMAHIKYLKCCCLHCQGNIEFPADAIGATIDCPHCGAKTELYLPEPVSTDSSSKKPLVVAIFGLLIVGVGLAAAFSALNTAKKMALKKQEAARAAAAPAHPPGPPQPPPPKDGFSTSLIELEKTPGSSLVHAVGTVTNDLKKQRFGVKIEIELLDAAGKTIGTAKDYTKVLDENAEWHFHALVMNAKADSAKLAWVKEDQ
jgi:hypothetical protein